MAASRRELLEAHVIHSFDRAVVMANLRGCYGNLVARFYRRLLPLLRGRRLVDCGCGFGLFSFLAREAGFEVASLDIDDDSLEIARSVYGIDCLQESVYHTSLPDGSRDVAVFFDSVQHLDLDLVLAELRRLGVRQVVISDSNEDNPLLRLYRRLADHEEANAYSVEHLVRTFAADGYRLTLSRYENFVSLPVSGGLQRPPLPLLSAFPSLIHAVDRVLERVAPLLLVQRLLAFRFVIVMERSER